MPTVTRRLLTALVALWAMCAWGATGTREHPLLFVTQQEIDAARERAATIPWARQRIDAIVREADAALNNRFILPGPRGAQGRAR